MSLRELLSTARGRATVACNILALIGMAPFLVIEASAGSASVSQVVSEAGSWACLRGLGRSPCLFNLRDFLLPAAPACSPLIGTLAAGVPFQGPGPLPASCLLPLACFQGSTIAAYGWGWATAWNLLDTATYAIQVGRGGWLGGCYMCHGCGWRPGSCADTYLIQASKCRGWAAWCWASEEGRNAGLVVTVASYPPSLPFTHAMP